MHGKECRGSPGDANRSHAAYEQKQQDRIARVQQNHEQMKCPGVKARALVDQPIDDEL